jgi:membrane fusion protein (multidrug efflux system)
MSKKLSDKRTPAGTRRSWLRRNAIKVIIVLVAAGLLMAVSKIPKEDRQAPPTEAPPVNVSVLTVTAEPEVPDTFGLPAVIEPNRVVTIAAEVAGRIERIGPEKGDAVSAGDLLIELNSDLLRPQFEMAKTQVEFNEIEFERMANLVKENATARRDLDNARAQRDISKAQLEEIEARLNRTRIVAPITGVLDHLPVEIGEYVQTDTAVADIVETATVKVVVEVPERDISFFSVGDKADVLAMVKGREVSVAGTITFISELADPQTRSTRMEIMLRNDDHRLRSGQIVQARLTRQVLQDVILIPLLAVIPMEEGKSVYVVESSKAERREVKLGVIKGDRIQITSGLQPGDQLIVAGHRFVAPGQNVNVVSEGK